MAARTLPVASLPSGSLERHEMSSHCSKPIWLSFFCWTQKKTF